MIRKFLIIIIFFIFSVSNLMSQKNSSLENLILSVQKELVPDKRISVFDITFELNDNVLTLKGDVSDSEYKEHLIKKIKESGNYTINDEINILPDKKLGDKVFGIINLSVANLRTKPDHFHEMATQSILGTPVKVLKEHEGFYLIQTPNDYLGWLDDDGLVRINKDEFDEWNKSKKVIYKNHYGLIRLKTDLNSEVVSDIVEGCIVKVISEKDGFSHIELPDGRSGFLPSSDLEDFSKWMNNSKPNAQEILNTAKSFMGFPYLWGGTSIKGIDCSGFTGTAYFLNGVLLPRDANQQAKAGDEITIDESFSNLKPGDLLFFGRKKSNDNPEKISHVGIYLGDKDYIHSSGRVRINSFDKDKANYNAYRHKSLVKVKRILDSKDLEKYLIINNKFYKKYENR